MQLKLDLQGEVDHPFRGLRATEGELTFGGSTVFGSGPSFDLYFWGLRFRDYGYRIKERGLEISGFAADYGSMPRSVVEA